MSRKRRARRKPHRSRWFVVMAAALVAVAASVWLFGREDASQGPAAYVGGDLHSFAASPGPAGTLFVGGHEAAATSVDGGRTWTQIAGLKGADAMGWAFLDGAIWVGGHPGLRVSTDGGSTFEPLNEGLPATDIHALGGSGSTLYAASPAAGLLVSEDAGASWQVRNAAVGQGFMGEIQVDPSDDERIVASDMTAGAVQSRDGGRSWEPLGGVAGAMWISWDPTHGERMIVTGLGEAASSSDGGASWNALNVPPGTTIVEIDPGADRWYVALLTPDGTVEIWMSRDEGESWQAL